MWSACAEPTESHPSSRCLREHLSLRYHQTSQLAPREHATPSRGIVAARAQARSLAASQEHLESKCRRSLYSAPSMRHHAKPPAGEQDRMPWHDIHDLMDESPAPSASTKRHPTPKCRRARCQAQMLRHLRTLHTLGEMHHRPCWRGIWPEAPRRSISASKCIHPIPMCPPPQYPASLLGLSSHQIGRQLCDCCRRPCSRHSVRLAPRWTEQPVPAHPPQQRTLPLQGCRYEAQHNSIPPTPHSHPTPAALPHHDGETGPKGEPRGREPRERGRRPTHSPPRQPAGAAPAPSPPARTARGHRPHWAPARMLAPARRDRNLGPGPTSTLRPPASPHSPRGRPAPLRPPLRPHYKMLKLQLCLNFFPHVKKIRFGIVTFDS